MQRRTPMKASTATSDNSSDTKPNAREYPFLEINMGPFGKPTIRTYLSPRLNKSLTLPMDHKADREDWSVEKKRFIGDGYTIENKALDAAQKLYEENRQFLNTFSDVEEFNEKMRDLTTSVLDGTYEPEEKKATRNCTRRRHGFPGLSVSRKPNGSISVSVSKFGTARCTTVGVVEDSKSWDDSLKRVIGEDSKRLNDIMSGVEKLYAKHYAKVGSTAELDALRNKIAIMAGRIANEVEYNDTEAKAEDAPKPDGMPVTTTELITPEMAAEMLKRGVRNRTLSQQYVQQYAEDMRNGKWMLTGESIDINTLGELQNGFHRLHAVIEAGVPVLFQVTRGISPDAFAVYDCGRQRTAAQVLKLDDSKHSSLVASIVKLHSVLKANGRVLNKDTKCKIMTNQQVLDTYETDRKGYEDAAVVGTKYNRQFNAFSKAWAAAIYYYLTKDCRYSRKAVTDFYDSLFTMDTGKVQQADQLRKTMTDLLSKKYKIQDEVRWTYFARAWNAYIAGTPVKRLRVSVDSEDVPTVTKA